MKRQKRKLTIGDRTYWVSVGHRHDVDTSESGTRCYRNCVDILMFRSEHARASSLRIIFAGRPGHAVGDGINPSGIVIRWLGWDDETSMPAGVRPGRYDEDARRESSRHATFTTATPSASNSSFVASSSKRSGTS